MTESWNQLGVAGATLLILFFTVRYFISAMKDSRNDYKEITIKFIQITENNIKSNAQLTEAIIANTRATKDSIDGNKLSLDKLTELILKIIVR